MFSNDFQSNRLDFETGWNEDLTSREVVMFVCCRMSSPPENQDSLVKEHIAITVLYESG